MITFCAPDGTGLVCHVRGSGPPLVCLPGGPMRASEYLEDLGGLTDHRTLHVLDLRGTGKSAAPADPATYRCDRQVDDVEALRVRLGLERMDLLGHSAGGNLATLYAARYPERIGRLVLITSTPRPLGLEATPDDRRAAAALRRHEEWFGPAYAEFEKLLAGRDDAEYLYEAFFYGRWDARARAHAAGAEGQFNEEAAGRYAAEGAFDPPATRAALARLTAPVLLLAGELDGGPRPELVHHAAGFFPRGQVVVQPGAAHFPWLDDAGFFTARVAEFLAAR
ncbi:alpha/beta fold hydrolase [Streptomyces sp. VRA16 Mangrove soil]|uniref:alpha/beta fold hydrolase n=1 Tax=Streptomyces sp. VRA16 Mangrove soil TaxID=2817434 RepID=UPI001AA001B4|nr:alpha/beta hydrolase [Streptomyces sp. VRA16 Mangrove soil]MBO1332955.1 alpha/beta hydrolase [Streptomyces sp. VRA16 Mangrove soil]